MSGKEKKNKGGRPAGGFNRRSSKLRATERKLLAMGEDAVKAIQDSLEGRDVDSEVLSTAKWVINTTVTVTRAALAEEVTINAEVQKLREEAASSQDEEEDEEDFSKAEFSLKVVKK